MADHSAINRLLHLGIESVGPGGPIGRRIDEGNILVTEGGRGYIIRQAMANIETERPPNIVVNGREWADTPNTTVTWNDDQNNEGTAFYRLEVRGPDGAASDLDSYPLIAAKERSRKLLYRYLTPAQKRMLREKDSFFVKGGVTGNRYHFVVTSGYFKVLLYNRHYCLMANTYLPLYDKMLANLILIKFDEDTFLAKAIPWPSF